MNITRILNVPDNPTAIIMEGTARVPEGATFRDVKFRLRLSTAALGGLVRKAARNKSRKSSDGPLMITVDAPVTF